MYEIPECDIRTQGYIEVSRTGYTLVEPPEFPVFLDSFSVKGYTEADLVDNTDSYELYRGYILVEYETTEGNALGLFTIDIIFDYDLDTDGDVIGFSIVYHLYELEPVMDCEFDPGVTMHLGDYGYLGSYLYDMFREDYGSTAEGL